MFQLLLLLKEHKMLLACMTRVINFILVFISELVKETVSSSVGCSLMF